MRFALTAVLVIATIQQVPGADWEPAAGPLMTKWSKEVSPENALPEYPRPQMVRDVWLSLNGLWDYAIRAKGSGQPKQWDGKILVPYAVESALSGVMKNVGEDNLLWYRRSFEVQPGWDGQQLLLNFDAVDWQATVWLNGKLLGSHEGGYSRFTFDVTDALTDGPQELVVRVWDPTDTQWQPRGKQVKHPQGIMYTAVTGIWQTVWLEPVDVAHVESLVIVPDIDNSRVLVTAKTKLPKGKDGVAPPYKISVTAKGQGNEVSVKGRPNQQIALPIKDARLWSPDDPFLYDLTVTLSSDEDDDKDVDQVDSYFGMRKVSLGKDASGITRFQLNNQQLFMFGPLDQGWWPDGLYTAPTDEALRYDIEITKKLGFNMCRKHVKVEPDRWYYWCDKLGLLVWQDMPNGDKAIRPAAGQITRSTESAVDYRQELGEMVDQFQTHPSIVFWIPFNEGWGQFDTHRVVGWLKQHDPTRLVIGASGWNDIAGVGDAHDLHIYPGPGSPEPEAERAAVLGEYGGLGLPLPGHLWQEKKQNWGYSNFKDTEAIGEAYIRQIDKLRGFIATPGLSAAVYTQTTDVETEVNGLMTYDREVIKLGSENVIAANLSVYEKPARSRVLAPTSCKHAVVARYVTSEPSDKWFVGDFDDSSWAEGVGGFGNGMAWNSNTRTRWKTDDIWLRRRIHLGEKPIGKVALLVYYDDEADFYVNGIQLEPLSTGSNHYQIVPLSEAATKSLKVGENIFAVKCHNKPMPGRHNPGYIDFGLVEILPGK
ncbi:MAG: hypothetical protein N2C12_12225 [Planctomycetales bacterium]